VLTEPSFVSVQRSAQRTDLRIRVFKVTFKVQTFGVVKGKMVIT